MLRRKLSYFFFSTFPEFTQPIHYLHYVSLNSIVLQKKTHFFITRLYPECETTSRMWLNTPNVTQHPECDSTSRMWLNTPNCDSKSECDILNLSVTQHPICDAISQMWRTHLPNRITYCDRFIYQIGLLILRDYIYQMGLLPIVTDSSTKSDYQLWQIHILKVNSSTESDYRSWIWSNIPNTMQHPKCDATHWIWCNNLNAMQQPEFDAIAEHFKSDWTP